VNDPIPASPARTGRPGRPPGSRTGQSPARARILETARRLFAEGTYASTTVRAVAAEAGVNPALVIHYFGSKRDLFVATLRLPLHLRERVAALVRTDPADLGEQVVRLYLGLWQDPVTRAPLAAMLRSVFSDSEAAAALGRFLSAEMVGPIVAASGRDQPHLRVSLVAGQLVGLAIGRHVLAIAPLAEADIEHLVACLAPMVQHFLTGDLPRP
jgi:AcrR family transcriptional regulator